MCARALAKVYLVCAWHKVADTGRGAIAIVHIKVDDCHTVKHTSVRISVRVYAGVCVLCMWRVRTSAHSTMHV